MYTDYLETEHWQKCRRIALDRAGNRCQVCASSKNLQVHHNSYERVGREEIYDLVVLCDDCHGMFHWSQPSSVPEIKRAGDVLEVALEAMANQAGKTHHLGETE